MDVHIILTGTSPLLMHNQRLADPLDPYAKLLKTFTSKKSRTDDDNQQMSRVEFEGSIYFEPTLGPYLLGAALHRSFVEGARINKRGKDVDRGLVLQQEQCILAYSGPRDVDALFARSEFVSRMSAKVGQRRVMRTRPIFREWAVECDAMMDEGQLNFEDLCAITETAGSLAGLGDYRPSSPHGGPYGRYRAVVERM